jgi:hypothetical protein
MKNMLKILENPIEFIPEKNSEFKPTLETLAQSRCRVYYHDFGAGFYIKVRLARVSNKYLGDPELVLIPVDDNNNYIMNDYFCAKLSTLYLKIMPWMHGPVSKPKRNLYQKILAFYTSRSTNLNNLK